ncbi:MAG: hypothetical protein OEY34_00765 [Cyclobacteriaceae bacterium]|nr:hypothetical protein [Cyclobacteriaceae bacterium]
MFIPGQYGVDQIMEIRKAFEANTAEGGATPFVDPSSGATLSMQSLDKTFVAITSTDKDFSFLNQAPKRNVNQVLAEYNKQKSHGGGWYNSSHMGQSDEPIFRDAVLKRLYDEICYIGEGFAVNKPSETVDNVADPSLVQGNSALRRGMENLQRSIWFGNKSTNKLTQNGFLKKVLDADSTFVEDCRGQLPAVDLIKDHTASVRTKYMGIVNDMWMHNNTKALYDQLYDDNAKTFVWQNASQNPGNAGAGNIIRGIYDSNANDEMIRFKTDIWMDKHNWGVPMVLNEDTGILVEGPTSATESPETPVLALGVPAANPLSKFVAADAGVYQYRVSSGTNRHWSQACAIESATLAAGQSVELTITPQAGIPATRHVIFRSIAPGSTDVRYMKEVADSGGGTTVYTDKNDDIPGTTIMVLGDFNSRSDSDENRTHVLSELLPFTKTLFPYGSGGKFRMKHGMVEAYLVMQILTEEKFRVFKNVPVRK